MSFVLNTQLEADCFNLGTIDDCSLLLHKNALVPWFILVPHTNELEIYKIDTELQSSIHNTTNKLASFTESHFLTDKLNIATIGNIVPQLHIHVIGRFINDFCWPAPIWGQPAFEKYKDEELLIIKQALKDENLL